MGDGGHEGEYPDDEPPTPKAKRSVADRVIEAVATCHDGSDLWGHLRQDPDAFRRAVAAVLEAPRGPALFNNEEQPAPNAKRDSEPRDTVLTRFPPDERSMDLAAYLMPLIRRLREGGHVQRCHVLYHRDHGYTDGKHSFDAASLLLVLHPCPPIHLIKMVLWHDVGERYVGDLPASAKWASAMLSAAYEALERQVLESHFVMKPLLEAMTKWDWQWLKALDAVEFYLWCEDQLAAGNRHVEMAWRNITEALETMRPNMPTPVQTFYDQHRKEGWQRMPERYDR